MKPRAFVVMPFGLKAVPVDSSRAASAVVAPARVDFDGVYNLLIAPALADAGCDPFRADLDPAAESIVTGMYFELLKEG